MKHFLAIADLSPAETQDLLDLALKLKEEYFKKGNPPLFKGKVLGMIFQKPSLRTRISFDMAMRHCGGDALYLSPNEIGLGKRESIADIARVLSGYVQALMARTFEHTHVLELAKWSDIPVVNGLSDYNHPCQGMADALTIQEKFGKAKGLNEPAGCIHFLDLAINRICDSQIVWCIVVRIAYVAVQAYVVG